MKTLQYLDLRVRCLEKVPKNSKYSPKWWFDGGSPMVEPVNKHKKNMYILYINGICTYMCLIFMGNDSKRFSKYTIHTWIL